MGIVGLAVVVQVKRSDVEIVLSIVPKEVSELLNPANIAALNFDIQSGIVGSVSKLQRMEADAEAPIQVEWIVGILVSRCCQPTACNSQPLHRAWRVGIHRNGPACQPAQAVRKSPDENRWMTTTHSRCTELACCAHKGGCRRTCGD